MSKTHEELMAPLFAQAEASGTWFFCAYQQLVFSPQELRDANAAGRFRWGPLNWELRRPEEEHERLHGEVQKAVKELEVFEQRMEKDRNARQATSAAC